MEEVKNKTKVDELDELLEKISIAMDMTRDKQNNIDKMTNDLYNEVKPMMVEKMKNEIEQAQNDKTEFDEMTENALINAKKSILEIMEESEKAYQDKLLETLKRKQDIDRKLSSMRKGEYPQEKIISAETYANKAMEKVNAEMDEFKKSHFKLIKKLSEYEKTIYDNAVELGIEQKIDEVTLKDKKVEPVKKEQKKVEPVKSEPKKVEPVKSEPKKVEPVKSEPKKVEPVKSEPKKVEPVKTEPKKVEPVKAEPKKVEPVKAEPKKVEPVKTEPKKVEPVKAEPKKVEPVKAEPKKVEPEKENPKQEHKGFENIYPISQDTVEALIDVNDNSARLSIKVAEDSYIGCTLNLEELMNSKNQRKIRKEIEERFKESGEKKNARLVRKLKRKINPALLALAFEGDDGLDILRKYITAVRIGDKEALPFKYSVNLDGEIGISEKAFAKLNGYLAKDNKNLGTNFDVVEEHPVKNVLNRILPNKKRIEDKKTKLLSAPEQIKNIGNQTKEKALEAGKNVAEEIQVAGIKMAGYMKGENQHLTEMKVNEARNSFVPKAKVDEKLAVEKCNQLKDCDEQERNKNEEIKE